MWDVHLYFSCGHVRQLKQRLFCRGHVRAREGKEKREEEEGQGKDIVVVFVSFCPQSVMYGKGG